MSEPLHKRMFRKWGKDRCRQAYRFRSLGMDYPYIRDKLWPYGDGGTSRSVKSMVAAWQEWVDIRAGYGLETKILKTKLDPRPDPCHNLGNGRDGARRNDTEGTK